jgi:hypothetical protein
MDASVPGNHSPEEFFRKCLWGIYVEGFAMHAMISCEENGFPFGLA